MNTQILMRMGIVSLMLTSGLRGNSSPVLWNDQCPPSYARRPEEGKSLKKEIPDFHRDFRLQLQWQGGKVCKDPNERIKKEILLTKKILTEVFKRKVGPTGSMDGKFLLLSGLEFKNGKEDAVVFRFRKNKYILKIMKTFGKKGRMFITIRPTSGGTIGIRQLAEDVFKSRILPANWEKPFYYGKLKRKSKVLIAGMWMARDTWRIGASGEIIAVDSDMPEEYGSIGEGLYKRIDFYTNGKFACLQILGGPRLPSCRTEDSRSTKNDGSL